MDEVQFLKNNVNQILSFNTFVSASLSCSVAKMFFHLDGPYSDKSSEQSVLYTIKINDIDEDTMAFAFIETDACNSYEREVLFTINAIFIIESVKQEEHLWYVHLQLNKQQKHLSKYMINVLGSDPSPSVFGWFIYRMSDFEKAKRYVQYIIQQPLEEAEKAAAYNLFGLIYSDRKNYKKSIEYYQKAIEIYDDSEHVVSPQTIAIHNNFTLAYLADGDIRLADFHIEKNPLLITMSKTLEGKLSALHGDNGEALENLEASLQEKKKTLPLNSLAIADTLHEMGVMYAKMENETEALACFEETMKIGEQSLSVDYFELSEYYADLGQLRYKHKEYELASKQFERALKIITPTSIRTCKII